MNTDVIHEITRLAFANQIAFPEVVQRLISAGVESYYADLLQQQKIFYGTGGEVWTEPLPLENRIRIVEQFSKDQVQGAIRASQSGTIDYPEFLRRIMAAGTITYTVYLIGKRAIYFGRQGDFHVEYFPGTKRE